MIREHRIEKSSTLNNRYEWWSSSSRRQLYSLKQIKASMTYLDYRCRSGKHPSQMRFRCYRTYSQSNCHIKVLNDYGNNKRALMDFNKYQYSTIKKTKTRLKFLY
jgi:hypothetical protein